MVTRIKPQGQLCQFLDHIRQQDRLGGEGVDDTGFLVNFPEAGIPVNHSVTYSRGMGEHIPIVTGPTAGRVV